MPTKRSPSALEGYIARLQEAQTIQAKNIAQLRAEVNQLLRVEQERRDKLYREELASFKVVQEGELPINGHGLEEIR